MKIEVFIYELMFLCKYHCHRTKFAMTQLIMVLPLARDKRTFLTLKGWRWIGNHFILCAFVSQSYWSSETSTQKPKQTKNLLGLGTLMPTWERNCIFGCQGKEGYLSSICVCNVQLMVVLTVKKERIYVSNMNFCRLASEICQGSEKCNECSWAFDFTLLIPEH